MFYLFNFPLPSLMSLTVMSTSIFSRIDFLAFNLSSSNINLRLRTSFSSTLLISSETFMLSLLASSSNSLLTLEGGHYPLLVYSSSFDISMHYSHILLIPALSKSLSSLAMASNLYLLTVAACRASDGLRLNFII
jgi:hypothetical protein